MIKSITNVTKTKCVRIKQKQMSCNWWKFTIFLMKFKYTFLNERTKKVCK